MSLQLPARLFGRLFPSCFKSTVAIALLYFQLAFVAIAMAQACATDAVASLSCEAQSDPGVVGSQSPVYRHVGNPIDVVTGSKQQREMDYQAVGSALHFSRYYHSAQTDAHWSLGRGWRHSYMVKLYNVGLKRWRLQQADGRWIDFSLSEQNDDTSLFIASLEKDGYLIKNDSVVNEGRVKWRLPDGRTFYFQGSYLTRIEYPEGNGLALFYKNKKLVSVTDEQGRKLVLEYTPNESGLPDYTQSQAGIFKGQLRALILPSGQRVVYRYDRHRNLVQANYQEKHLEKNQDNNSAHSSDYSHVNSSYGGHENQYGQSIQYDYLNSDYPHHLSSIISTSVGHTKKRAWDYDAFGRVVQFRHGLNGKSLSLSYDDDVAADHNSDGLTTVEYGDGRQEHYHWDSATGSPAVSAVIFQDCVDCQQVRLQPAIDKPQSGAQALLNERRLSDATSVGYGSLTQSVGGAQVGAFPTFDQLNPLPQSLDQTTEINVDGLTRSFVLKSSRLGQVDDISVGSTSLSELKDKWTQGNIERCDAQPLLRRSDIFPAPLKGCLEDLIYLIELVDHIEQLNLDHNLRRSNPQSPIESKDRGKLEDRGKLKERGEIEDRSAPTNRSAVSCFTNPFLSCSALERDFQLAQLASCAYATLIATCGDGWQVITPSSIGLNDSIFNHDSFAATLFYNANNNEYILSFRGSDNLGDWKDNFLQSSGAATSQYKRAVALAKQLSQSLPGVSLGFTGHSLGGGLATAAALTINAEATVFNPAALHPDTAVKLGLDYTKAEKLVKVTTVDGDLLTAIQASAPEEKNVNTYPVSGRFPAPGVHRQLAAPSADWINKEKKHYSFLARGEGIILHSINAVLETEENMLVELCGKTPSSA